MQRLHDAGLLKALASAKTVESLRGLEQGKKVIRSLTDAMEEAERKCEHEQTRAMNREKETGLLYDYSTRRKTLVWDPKEFAALCGRADSSSFRTTDGRTLSEFIK